MGERFKPGKGEVTENDLKILIGPKQRERFTRARRKLELSTRGFAKLAHTSHGTVSNVELGVHPTMKRTAYVHYVRAVENALRGPGEVKVSIAGAEKLADAEIERTRDLVDRIVKATLSFDNEDLEQAAGVLELLASRKSKASL